MRYIKLLLSMFSVMALTFMGCDKEEYGIDSVTPTEPVVEGIIGSAEVDMGSTGVSYSVEAPRTAAGSTYSWSVSGGSASSTDGDAISVSFLEGATSATISVTETTASGSTGSSESIQVALAAVPLTYDVVWESPVAIRDGDSARVFVQFNVDIASNPALAVISGGGAFGTAVANDSAVVAYYTHTGGGDGMVEFSVIGGTATSVYGGLSFAGDTLSIIEIDNTHPEASAYIGADEAGSVRVQPGTPIELFIEFDEAMQSLGDSALAEIEYTVVGTRYDADLDEDVVVVGEQTVTFSTEDNEVYSVLYLPELESGDEELAGTTLTFTLETDTAYFNDEAGNELFDTDEFITDDLPTVSITIDNVAPDEVESYDAEAVESADGFVNVDATSFSGGTKIYYAVVRDDIERDEDDNPLPFRGEDDEGSDDEYQSLVNVPTTLADFDGSFDSGDDFDAGFYQSGEYSVYFVAEDAAGNIDLSTITAEPILVVVPVPEEEEVE